MTEQKEKRVFAGFYRRYDFIDIRVLILVDDVDNGEEFVLFKYEGKHNDGKNHSMTLRSFCENIEYNGKMVPKFKRSTNRIKDSSYDRELKELGFELPRKHVKMEEQFFRSRFRMCRQCSTYELYAKDMCLHYKEDLYRHDETIAQKRWVGVMGGKQRA